LVYASKQQVPGILAETQFFGHRSSNVRCRWSFGELRGQNGCLEES